jgi:integrase/recombinase XerC
MGKRKHVQYTTPELIEQINPKNKEIWRKYLNGKRTLAESSKNSYTSDINQFFVFMLKNYDNQCIFDIDTDDMADIIEDFLAMCQSVFENKDRRMQRRLSSISSLYLYYKKKRKIKENVVDLLERPKVQKGVYEIKRVFLTKEQVEQIREGLKQIDNTQLTLVFELGLFTMARVNAISSIRLDQIDFENKVIKDVIEKEGYSITYNINDRCIELIKQWLAERKEKGIECDYLFITNYNGWRQASVGQFKSAWIKQIGAIINEPELSMHDLRHSGSDLRYKAGMSLEAVSRALSHRSTSVTKDFYLQEDTEALKQEMLKFDI